MMKPIVEKDVPKVVQAIRQTQSRKVLYKLLTRIKVLYLSSTSFVSLMVASVDNRGSSSAATDHAFAWIHAHEKCFG